MIKFGQEVVHIVPDHLQKTAHQNLFPFLRYLASKMAFLAFFGPKKFFWLKNFFFHFWNLHPSIRENKQKKFLTWKISHSEVTQVWHLENFSKISKNFFAQIIFQWPNSKGYHVKSENRKFQHNIYSPFSNSFFYKNISRLTC